MSTDGPTPPSIAPKRPATSPGSRPADAQPRRVTTSVAGDVAPTVTGAPVELPPAKAAPAKAAPAKVPTAEAGPAVVDAAPSKVSTPSAPVTAAPAPRTGVMPVVEPKSPSIGDRLKKAAGAARNALPTRDEAPVTTTTTATSGTPTPAAPAPARTSTATKTGAAAPAPSSGPRRVRLAVSRVDPWSVMKLSFLLSVAIGIMIVVAGAVTWLTLDSLHVFTQVNDVIATLAGSTTFFDVLEVASFQRVLALSTMIGVVDIILLTALSTIGAFLYNIVAALVGGVHLTLTDD